MSVTLLSATITVGNVCQLYYNDESSFCVDHTAHCYGPYVPAITCEEAYIRVARRYGAVPLPPVPDGLLRVPLIIESDRPAEVADAVTEDPTVKAIVRDVMSEVQLVNAELANWAPRVLYVPDRIGAVLRSLMASLRDLANLNEYTPAILRSFHSSEPMSEFLFRVSSLTDVAVQIPDLRRNGFLNALIPFLHVATEIIFLFPFRDLGGVLVEEVALIQTITQYHPMYTDDTIWRFRLFNPDHVKWKEYPVERYILPVETRIDEWCPNAAPVDTSICYGRVQETLRTFTERASQLATNVGNTSVSTATGELFADILYFMDRMYRLDGYKEFFSFLSGRMRLMCSSQLGELCRHIRFSRFTRTRSHALLFWFLPDCVPESVRIRRVISVQPITTSGENCPAVDRNSGRDLLQYFSIQSPILLMPCIDRLWSESDKIRTIISALALEPNIYTDPVSRLGCVQPDTSMEDRRAMGRIIGFFLSDFGEGIAELRLEDVFRSIFHHSAEIRRGVYDIIPYGGLETLRRNIHD